MWRIWVNAEERVVSIHQEAGDEKSVSPQNAVDKPAKRGMIRIIEEFGVDKDE